MFCIIEVVYSFSVLPQRTLTFMFYVQELNRPLMITIKCNISQAGGHGTIHFADSEYPLFLEKDSVLILDPYTRYMIGWYILSWLIE